MSAHDPLFRHRVRVSGAAVPGVQALIELRLRVTTKAQPDGDKWAIDFLASKGENLDFLRPNVLPPRDMTVDQYVRYIETGYREPHVYLPGSGVVREAHSILVARGVIDA